MSASPIVDPDWLTAHLEDDDLLVVDASADMSRSSPGGYVDLHDQYLAGHVPGAVFANVVNALSEPGAALPLTRLETERLATAFGALGIGDETMVVLYEHWIVGSESLVATAVARPRPCGGVGRWSACMDHERRCPRKR